MTDAKEPTVSESVSELETRARSYFADHYDEPVIHLAAFVVLGSLIKLGDFTYPEGHCDVTLTAFKAAPEYTPKEFEPETELDKLLWSNPEKFSQKITFPFAYTRLTFWKALGKNIVALEGTPVTTTVQVRKSTSSDPDGLRVELTSKALSRVLHLDISASA